VALVREKDVLCPRRQIRTSTDAAKLFRLYLGDDVPVEHFMLAMVNVKHHVIGVLTLSIGSLTGSTVHPRHVFQPAILHNAYAIFLGHNHPSSDVAPSREDMVLTQRLVSGGTLLGIEVLDHIILGDGSARYYSFADNGMLQKEKRDG